MTFNTNQGSHTVVSKQRLFVPNDVIF